MRTTRDVWANLGMLGKTEAAPESPKPEPALRQEPVSTDLPSPNPARSTKSATNPPDQGGGAERPSTGQPTARGAKPRVARPYPLHISVTARAEELIRAGIAAKRSQGLRGHAASITTVVEEALETALGAVLRKNAR